MTKKNVCIDCGKGISRRAKRCKTCTYKYRQSSEYRHNQAVTAKARWKNPETKRRHIRGLKAAHVGGCYDNAYQNSGNKMRAAWARGDFDNLRRPPAYCIDCGAELSRRECVRCKPCATKIRWQDAEFRDRLIMALKDAHARGCYDGVLDNPEVRQKRSKSMKAAWRNGAYDGVFRSPTSIELAVAGALDTYGIEHRSQYRPPEHSRIYDEFISPNILIEIHGDFFHSDEFFPGITQRDNEKAQWAEDNGFFLVVIWEHEIEKYGGKVLVKDRILPLL